MSAECCAQPRKRWLALGLAYTPAAALAVLLPKCPLCIAAQLALLGVTFSVPSSARGLAIAISLALGTFAVVMLRTSAGRRP
jgi:hypothetical protein